MSSGRVSRQLGRARIRGEPTLLSKKLRAKGQLIPAHRWHIGTGDKVQIMSGKDRGMQGVVQRVIRAENRLFVKGLNLHWKAVKARGNAGEGGGRFQREAPVHYSNVMLLDPATVEDGWPEVEAVPTRHAIGWDNTGRRVRVAKKSGQIIERPEYQPKMKTRTDGFKDTQVDLATKTTKETKETKEKGLRLARALMHQPEE
jgi:large subunit ribosomal protein L24